MNLLAIKILIALAALGALTATYLGFVHHERDIGREEVRAEYRAEAARETEASNKESFRRIARQKESQDAYTAEISRARADAAGAAAVAQRLSVRLAQFVAAGRAGATNPATGGERATADDPIGVLADVFSRADRRAGVLAEYADAARIAGLQCERSYDALTVKP